MLEVTKGHLPNLTGIKSLTLGTVVSIIILQKLSLYIHWKTTCQFLYPLVHSLSCEFSLVLDIYYLIVHTVKSSKSDKVDF